MGSEMCIRDRCSCDAGEENLSRAEAATNNTRYEQEGRNESVVDTKDDVSEVLARDTKVVLVVIGGNGWRMKRHGRNRTGIDARLGSASE